MSRYIDAEWVQDRLSLADECKECRRNVDQCVHNTIDVGIVCTAIDDAPSIDIVRCKECENWLTDWVPKQYKGVEDLHYCVISDGYKFGDFFCADGERSTDE